MSLFPILLESTLLIALWLCLGVWQKDPTAPGRRTFIALAFSAVIWGLGELALARELLDEGIADRIKLLGALAVPPLWLGLAAHVSRLEIARHVPWFPAPLLAPQVCLYTLMWSERWGGLFLKTVPQGPDLLGPLWWVAVVYGYALVVIGSAILLATAWRWPQPGQWGRRIALGLAPLVPLTGNAVYLAIGDHWPNDPTPILLGVAMLALRSAIFSGGLLQALPVADHDLIRQLPLGVILTDRHGTVIDVNPAAERRLGLLARAALGRTLDGVLAAAPDVRVEVTPVRASGRESGHLVLLDPPPKER